jgi:hypothetical protein
VSTPIDESRGSAKQIAPTLGIDGLTKAKEAEFTRLRDYFEASSANGRGEAARQYVG